MASTTVTISLFQGGTRIGGSTFSQDMIKIGSGAGSDVIVSDPSSEERHALIEVGGDGTLKLTVLASSGSAEVNGAAVPSAHLNAGDRIRIGEFEVVIDSKGAVANPFAAAPSAVSNPFASAPAASANPFASAPAASVFGAASGSYGAHAVPDDAPPGTYTFRMLKSGPDVPRSEIETGAPGCNVQIKWGDNVLHCAQLNPPRNFYVGEEESKGFSCDVLLPAARIGTNRMPVVVGDAGSVSAVIPQGATGKISIPGQPDISLDEARGRSAPCAELPGAVQFALSQGAVATVRVEEFTFQVAANNAGVVVPTGEPLANRLASGFSLYFLGAMSSMGLLMASLYYYTPSSAEMDGLGIDEDQLYAIQQYLKSAADREQEEEETEQITEDDADNKEGGTGTRAKGEEGSMGKETSKATDRRYAVKGPADNKDPHLARQAALREAMSFGMIGLLSGGAAGDPDAPTAEFGRDTSSGSDEVSAMGNMWGSEIGEAFGAGGLGLTGIGEGGGGTGEGIGLGNIGTMGHGAGTGTGQGFGSGKGRLAGSHKSKAPSIRAGATQVNGRLPQEVIHRIVRQNFGRFRMCYEQGLKNNPSLEGRVQVRFVIGRDGAVSSASNGGSDIPDAGVVNCVVRAYYNLSFPAPEGGIVTVVYPISFSPG